MFSDLEAIGAIIESALESRGARFRHNEWWFLCPFHNDRHADNCSYHPGKKVFFCHVCNRGGGVFDLAPALGIYIEGRALDPAELDRIRADREAVAVQLAESRARQGLALAAWWGEAQLQAGLRQHDDVLAALERDGVSRAAADHFGMGWTIYGNGGQGVPALAIPWTVRGETRAVQYRLLSHETPGGRYRWHAGSRATIFNADVVLEPHDDTVVIVEGAKKCVAVHSHGITSVCGIVNKGGWKIEYAAPFAAFDRVVFALDPDATTEARAAALTITGARVAILPGKPDDMLVASGGDVDLFWSFIESARKAG